MPYNPLIAVLALLSLPRIIAGWKADPKTQPYYQVTASDRWKFAVAYLGLALFLGLGPVRPERVSLYGTPAVRLSRPRRELVMSAATCFYHPDQVASTACAQCAVPLCPACTETVAGKSVCRRCVAAIRARVASQINPARRAGTIP